MAFLMSQQSAGKLQQVTELMNSLEQDLKEKTLTTQERVQKLLQLRQHGTSPVNAGPIYSKNGVDVLMKYGVDGETPEVCRAALRCVANALLLDAKMRQIFVDTGYGGRLAEKLKCDNSEDEMVASRILFLSTYSTTMDYQKLISEHALGTNANYQISRHAAQFPESGNAALSQMDELAFIDTLKLIFNVSKLFPDLAEAFRPSLASMFTIILRVDIPTQPLEGIIGQLVNCISVLEVEGKEEKHLDNGVLFPESNPNANIDKLVKILDQAVKAYSTADLETKAVPLLYSLILIYEAAPEGPREHMKQLLLPEDQERNQPIGQTDTLPSKLLKTTITPHQDLRTAVFELVFTLSDKNAETLTKNIGYGYASGFMASRGMGVPDMEGATSSGALNPDINPITGQRWSAEPRDSGPPMTREEKEREAERLFVLFERYATYQCLIQGHHAKKKYRARANGILNVENPVRQAAQEGRFEELSDSDSD